MFLDLKRSINDFSVANLGNLKIPDLFADRGPNLADSIGISMDMHRAINTAPPIHEFLKDGKYDITGNYS